MTYFGCELNPQPSKSTKSEDLISMDIRYLIEKNNDRCEVIHCNASATCRIKLAIGNLGSITVSVCNGCIKKFSDSQEERSTK